jgi:glycosyltransferase involved in cell wall biosynthesis
MANVMAGLDLLVFPTHTEGFPLVVLEAEAAGLPIVASRVCSLPEQITDGVEGRLVPVKDPSALASAVIELARDPVLRKRMGEAGQARARREFTFDRMIREYEIVLEGLIRKSRKGGA